VLSSVGQIFFLYFDKAMNISELRALRSPFEWDDWLLWGWGGELKEA
jgi:hypothetical protein